MTFDVHAAALSIVENAIMQEPRSLQKVIGPSELGAACEHCVAAKLAGWEKRPEPAWLPWIGTAVHARLEKVFAREDGWLTETRVSVGRVGGFEVMGTSDLFHVASGTCVDFKTVGATTLKKAKGGPTAQYSAQAQLYAMGFLRAGYDVNQVAIWYMPRNAVSLRQGVWWQAPFDPSIALAALTRATELVERIEREGDGFIADLPRDPDCFDCKRFPDWQKPVPQLDSLESLLGI